MPRPSKPAGAVPDIGSGNTSSTRETQKKQPPKGGDGNRSDPLGYADYQTERGLTGQGEARPTQRSSVVPSK